MRWPAYRSEFGCSRMSSRSPRSMWKTTSSNPMPRSVLSFAFFASSQAKYFTGHSPSENRGDCAQNCARAGVQRAEGKGVEAAVFLAVALAGAKQKGNDVVLIQPHAAVPSGDNGG